MSTLYCFRNSFFILGLILLVASGCRKKIDFVEGENVSVVGPIDPTQPILDEWDEVYVGEISAVGAIESDGSLIYYNRFVNGSNAMYSIDTSGTTTYLFGISSSFNVTAITYQQGKLYYIEKVSNSLFTINEFDENGVINTYSLNILSSQTSYIETIIDLGSEFFVAGDFRFELGSNGSAFACKIDKVTGDSIPMPGLRHRAHDAVLFNNEIHVSGEILNQSGNLNGNGLAKWEGGQWTFLGETSGLYNQPDITSLGIHNGDLIVGGKLSVLRNGIGKYNVASNQYESNSSFALSGSNSSVVSVDLKEYNGKLYASGTLRFAGASFESVFELDNGNWRSIGALNKTSRSMTVCQDYAYVSSSGRLWRYKL